MLNFNLTVERLFKGFKDLVRLSRGAESFLDLVTALRFNLHKDCQMVRVITGNSSLISPKAGTWTKTAFDSTTSNGKIESSNSKTNVPLPCIYWDKAYQGNATKKKLAVLNFLFMIGLWIVVVQSLSCVQLFAPHELQHARRTCPSLSPRVCSNSWPLSQWCCPTISSYGVLFSSCPQSFPASGHMTQTHLIWHLSLKTVRFI